MTDSAYKVEMKSNYDLNSFIYSFYNTLTLLLCELNGRYYGGGVLELIPSEFKKLSIPYVEINSIKFNNFTKKFIKKSNIEDILVQNDLDILYPTLNINSEDLQKLSIIRDKLRKKRLKI